MTKKKILVVAKKDDRLRELIKGKFSEQCEITNTDDTSILMEALIIAGKPDLIFLDVFMPDMSGIKILIWLQQWTEVPVIMLTTWKVTEKDRVRKFDFSEMRPTKSFPIDEVQLMFERSLKEAPV